MNVTDGEFFYIRIEIVVKKATCYYVKLPIFVLKREKYCIYGLLQERRLSSKAEKKTRNEKSISQNIAD